MLDTATTERLKLAATFLNNIGVGMILTGGVAPGVALYIGAVRPDVNWNEAQVVLGALITLGFILHSAGSLLLRRLS